MNIKKELPLLLIIALPFLYLAWIWNDLPAEVPMHWNAKGEIDRYGSKTELLILPFVLPVMIYVILSVMPKIDPKQKLNNMGNKLNTLKFILTTFMSVLALYILHSAKTASLNNPNIILIMVGLLFTLLGNYFKTIKANYFIGIRTPWTLENEGIWKKTHDLGGKLWFVGGILIVLFSLILELQTNIYVFLGITGIISLIPTVYSYLLYAKEKQPKASNPD